MYNFFKIQYLTISRIDRAIKKYHRVYRKLSLLMLQYATCCRGIWRNILRCLFLMMPLQCEMSVYKFYGMS